MTDVDLASVHKVLILILMEHAQRVILIAAFVTIMLLGAKANNVVVNLETGDGIQYMLYAVLSVGCALCASAYFKTNRKKCAILSLLAALIPPLA